MDSQGTGETLLLPEHSDINQMDIFTSMPLPPTACHHFR